MNKMLKTHSRAGTEYSFHLGELFEKIDVEIKFAW